ncbi:DUF1616 domain-containing protein [Halostella salina]|uniref:DUF1616 domain-containing protein n=1 Tax=Halostella salina TaxID=1547897 RepID=UPI0013CED1D5|nr:DUF1616 domain-containing protein [Halostella salina]
MFTDLAAGILFIGALLTVALVSDHVQFTSVIQLLVGVPVFLFVPGYPITLVLFPRTRPEAVRTSESVADSFHQRALSPVERFALSVVTSVVVVAVVTLAVTLLPSGISELSIVSGIAAVTLLFTAAAATGHRRVPPEDRPTGLLNAIPTPTPERTWSEQPKLTLLNLMVVLSVILAASVVVFQPFGPPASEPFSEYQLLVEQPDGDLAATDYPGQFTAGENESLSVRIRNHEGQAVNYTVVVRVERLTGTDESPSGRVIRRDRFHVPVEAGGSRTVRRSPSLSTSGDYRLVYLFYEDSPAGAPDRESADGALHLRISVSEPSNRVSLPNERTVPVSSPISLSFVPNTAYKYSSIHGSRS